MYEKINKVIDANNCSVVWLSHEVRGMKRIIELMFVYFIGVVFVLVLALRVNEIERSSISNTSMASNSISVSNYE